MRESCLHMSDGRALASIARCAAARFGRTPPVTNARRSRVWLFNERGDRVGVIVSAGVQPQFGPGAPTLYLERRPRRTRRVRVASPARAAFGLLAALTGLAAAAAAQSPEDRGLAIALEAERRDSGFNDFTAELTMILRNRHGQESTREIRIRTLEVPEDGDKSLIIFDRPRDVKGTALLTYGHRVGADDQWLYLPALRRVKRIASGNKSGPFMGSEFAYEDISSQEVEKYTYRYLREELLDSVRTYVVERYPVDRNSGYTREVVWYDCTEFRVLKIEYYDRKTELLKTLAVNGYRQYLGRFWRAGEMHMVNHQTGKSTTLLFSEYRFRTGLGARDFDRNSLRRVR